MSGLIKKCGVLCFLLSAALFGCGGDSSSDSVDAPYTKADLNGTWVYEYSDSGEYYKVTFVYDGDKTSWKEEELDGPGGTMVSFILRSGTYAIDGGVNTTNGNGIKITVTVDKSVDESGTDLLEDFKTVNNGSLVLHDIVLLKESTMYMGLTTSDDDGGYPAEFDLTEEYTKQ